MRTLEETHQLTNEEINKRIHQEIMNLCWHDWKGAANLQSAFWFCEKCPRKIGVDSITDDSKPANPDYCNSISEAFKVVEKLKKDWQWFSDNQDARQYHVQFVQRRISPKFGEALEETLPKAICLAAIKTTEIKS